MRVVGMMVVFRMMALFGVRLTVSFGVCVIVLLGMTGHAVTRRVAILSPIAAAIASLARGMACSGMVCGHRWPPEVVCALVNML